MPRIALLDYGMGNLHSAAKALEHVGATVDVTHDPRLIAKADKIVFPGVGAMRDCMHGMQQAGIDDVVRHAVFNTPIMAICVGMQALFKRSAENNGVNCLGILSGEVKKFSSDWHDPTGQPIKIPHMGWNTVHDIDMTHPLWKGIDSGSHFYFVHSFYCAPDHPSTVAAQCDYGQAFCASIIQDNLFATQFHPEKSHTTGLQLLKNFVDWRI